jgi:hypothetical protein
MSHRTLPTLLIIGLFYTCSLQAQQAWVREKNSFYTQVGVSMLSADALLNGTNEPIPLGRTVNDLTAQFYGEYGLGHNFSISAQIPLKLLSVSSTTLPPGLQDGNMTSLSNIQAALTWQAFKKSGYVGALKLNAGLPTASFDEQTGLRSGFDATSITPSLLVGYGHSRFFTSAEFGYTWRSNDYSTRWIGGWQLGTTLGKKKRLIPILFVEWAVSGDSSFDDESGKTTGLYLNTQSYVSPGLKLGYKFNSHWMAWASLGAAAGAVTKDVAASPGMSLSISYQR